MCVLVEFCKGIVQKSWKSKNGKTTFIHAKITLTWQICDLTMLITSFRYSCYRGIGEKKEDKERRKAEESTTTA